MPKKRGPQPRDDVRAARLKRFRGRLTLSSEDKVKSKKESIELPEGSEQKS